MSQSLRISCNLLLIFSIAVNLNCHFVLYFVELRNKNNNYFNPPKKNHKLIKVFLYRLSISVERPAPCALRPEPCALCPELKHLHPVQSAVHSIRICYQLLMCPLLHYPPIIYHNNEIGMLNGRQTVSYNNRGTIFHKSYNGILNQFSDSVSRAEVASSRIRMGGLAMIALAILIL